LLFTSLLVQASAAMLHAGSRQDAYGRSRTKAFRQSFLVSYAVRIGERLSQAAEHATQEAAAEQEAAAGQPADAVAGPSSAGAALVPFLAARRQAVDDAVDDMFGGTLRRGRSLRVADEEGWASGRAAADLASLHNNAPVRP
jgi:membrane protein involved in colicin uptake